jgi:hypothetical protein
MSDVQELTLEQLEQETGEQIEGFEPTADPFAGPPPVPDGEYVVTLSLGDKEAITKRTSGKSGKDYYQVRVVAKIVDPTGKVDGRYVFDRVNTVIFGNSRSTRVAGVLQALGIMAQPSDAVQAAQLAKALKGSPQCRIKTRWETQCKNGEGKYITLFKGQKNHPVLEDGSHSFTTTTPEGDDVNAQVVVVNYKKL